MTLSVGLLGLCITLLGVVGVFSPPRVIAFVGRFESPSGLRLVAGIRILLGIALILAAGGSRWPLYLQVLGGISLFSGLVTPLFGVRRFAAVLRWWRERPLALVRCWSVLVALFGLSLVWAVLP